MNSLESEYSFLAPTWKLPSVATPSMYSPSYGTTYSSNPLDLGGPDWSLWNNTMYNSRYIPSYIPSTTVRRSYPISTNHQRIVIPSQPQNYQTSGGPMQSGPPYYQQINNQYGNNINYDDGFHPNNEYESYNNIPNYGQSQHQTINRGLTYATNRQNNPPPGQKRRVQIIDHNRQTPSTVINDHIASRQSYNSNSRYNHTSESNKSQQKSKPSVPNKHHDHVEENRFGYTGNNFNIHEYLYGLSLPDPGSYANAFKHHQRRLQEEKPGRKSVMSEYKSFAQNGGFGPAFGNTEHFNYGEKIDGEKKKKTYSKAVRQTNQYKIEEQKRLHDINGPQKNRTVPIPNYQRPDATRSHFLPTQEAREYANKIERPQHLKPVSQTEFLSQIPTVSPILITSLSHNQRRTSLDSIQSSNLSDLVSGEFNINQSRRSSSASSIRIKRRVRFRSRDFIRPYSSTVIDLPSHIIGKGISCRTNSLLNSKDEQQNSAFERLQNSSNFLLQTTLNKNEKKIITPHSMIMTKNMRLPPTATVVINQTYKPSLITTTLTNNHLKKSILKKDLLPSQRSLTASSIPDSLRKFITNSQLDFDLKIKSFHHTNDENNSSNG